MAKIDDEYVADGMLTNEDLLVWVSDVAYKTEALAKYQGLLAIKTENAIIGMRELEQERGERRDAVVRKLIRIDMDLAFFFGNVGIDLMGSVAELRKRIRTKLLDIAGITDGGFARIVAEIASENK